MGDRLIIVGKDGQDRFILDEHDNLIDIHHDHDFSGGSRCSICGLTSSQILEENTDAR